MTTLYLSNGNSTIAFDYIGPSRQEAVESKDAKPRKWAFQSKVMKASTQPQLHLMACANHEGRCLPLCLLHLFGKVGPVRHSIGLPLMHSNLPTKARQSSKYWSTLLQVLLALLIWKSSPFVHYILQVSLRNLCLLHLFGITGPVRHSIGLPLMHSNLPKARQSSKYWSTLLQVLLALLIWKSSPFVQHILQGSLRNLCHNEPVIPSMRSARRLHAHVDALRSNCS